MNVNLTMTPTQRNAVVAISQTAAVATSLGFLGWFLWSTIGIETLLIGAKFIGIGLLLLAAFGIISVGPAMQLMNLSQFRSVIKNMGSQAAAAAP